MPPKQQGLPQRRDRQDDNHNNNNTNNNNNKNLIQPTITGFFKAAIHLQNVPCKYFTGAPGSCRDGTNCKYLHSEQLMANNNNDNNRGSSPTKQQQSSVAAATPSIPQVQVPWSANYTVIPNEFSNAPRPFWDVIKNFLAEEVESIDDCLSLIAKCALLGVRRNRNSRDPPYDGLRAAIERMPHENPRGPSFSSVFLHRILPKIIKYALLAPRAFPNGIPLLTAKCSPQNNKLVFTQLQVSILLCVGFFGLYPAKPRGRNNNYCHGPPGLNLTSLYNSTTANNVAKIQCLLAYFNTISEDSVAHERERGKPCYFDIEFIRTVIPDDNRVKALSRMSKCENRLVQISVDDTGVIETQDGKLQADFANLSIGGGVLHHGCVQEEIRFVISPELMVSRLFVEDLTDLEAVVMSGTLRYSEYTGYGGGFQYTNRIFPLPQPKQADIERRMFDISVVAFDAIDFASANITDQYRLDWIFREMLKAFVAFLPVAGSKAPSANCCNLALKNTNNETSENNQSDDGSGWIATGNWGCGVFGGDLELKFILQLIAASALRRPMQYLTFSKTDLSESIINIYELMDDKKMTVTQLVAILYDFAAHHESIQDEYQRQMEEADNPNDVPNPYVIAQVNSNISNNKKKPSNNNNNNKKQNVFKSGGGAAASVINVDEDSDNSNETVAYDENDDDDAELETISPERKLPESLFKFIATEIRKAGVKK